MVLGDHRQGDPPTVGAAERPVTRGAARRLRAPTEKVGGARSRPGRNDVGHRDVDALTLPRPYPFRPRGRDAKGGHRARGEIGDRDARDGRRLAFSRRERACQRLVVHVVARSLDVRTRLSVPRHRAVDDRRVDRSHVVVSDTEAGGNARSPSFAEHVGPGREIQCTSPVLRRAQVELDTSLVPGDVAEQLRERAHRIATRRFDLQDLRAEVGQHLGRVRDRTPDARVEHAHPVEKTRHGYASASRNRWRNTNFCTLPLAVRGNSSTDRRCSGHFWRAIPACSRYARTPGRAGAS